MEFWKAAAVRAVRTMAQGAITLIGTNTVNIVDLNWPQIAGCVATMGVLSILTSLAGLPEVKGEPLDYDDECDSERDIREVLESEVPNE